MFDVHLIYHITIKISGCLLSNIKTQPTLHEIAPPPLPEKRGDRFAYNQRDEIYHKTVQREFDIQRTVHRDIFL